MHRNVAGSPKKPVETLKLQNRKSIRKQIHPALSLRRKHPFQFYKSEETFEICLTKEKLEYFIYLFCYAFLQFLSTDKHNVHVV
jgi:hypothetical protein